jgi:hypothetical protein
MLIKAMIAATTATAPNIMGLPQNLWVEKAL